MLLIKPTLCCNMGCTYCYENKWRSEFHPEINYDLDAILRVAEEYKGKPIVLHGGEPLLLPIEDVEKILALANNKVGYSSVQTNGTLITDAHIRLFEKYNTHVGFSLDGLGELNSYRLDEKATAKVFSTLLELHSKGIKVSMISVVSKSNAGTDEKLEQFEQFIATLSNLGIIGRMNPCVDDYNCMLEEGRLIEVYKRLAWFVLSHGWRWSPFIDMWNSLEGADKVVCVFKNCDIFHTSSAEVVTDDGSITNCMRVSSKGMYLRDSKIFTTRDEVLSQVEQEFGGCKGCQFWKNCYGGCPTQTIDNDWRNRTNICSLYKEIFKLFKNIHSFGGPKCSIDSYKLPNKEQLQYDHLDGNTRHMDSEASGGTRKKQPNRPGSNYTDGIEHLDGNTRHIDSGKES